MSFQTLSLPGRLPRGYLIAILALLGALGLWFLKDNVLPYSTYDAATYSDFWDRRAGFLPHLIGGSVAVTTGLLQLWLGFTGRAKPWHRTIGKIYLAAVAIGSAGGFYLAATTVHPATLGYRSGLFMLSTAWAITTAMAYLAVRQRDFQQHSEWMTRSYTVTFAFVSFRLANKLLLLWGVKPDADYDAMLAWGCWALPLLLVEPLIQLRRARRT